jgi:CheY-like chemotaxis protein
MLGPRLAVEVPSGCAHSGAALSPVSGSDAQGSAAAGQAIAASWIRVASPRTILIVDDNDRHLDILAAILGGVGHDIETCGSGADALRRMSARRYEVVVLDLVMPEVNGVTVAREMRNGGYNVPTPVIICTANVAMARRQLVGIEGIHAIVSKPIDTAALVLAVANAPMRDRPSRQLRMPG